VAGGAKDELRPPAKPNSSDRRGQQGQADDRRFFLATGHSGPSEPLRAAEAENRSPQCVPLPTFCTHLARKAPAGAPLQPSRTTTAALLNQAKFGLLRPAVPFPEAASLHQQKSYDRHT
jgi:hypothetical protein